MDTTSVASRKSFEVERTEKKTSCSWKGALGSNGWLQLRRKRVARKLNDNVMYFDVGAIQLFICGDSVEQWCHALKCRTD
jgi:hypothetical protein